MADSVPPAASIVFTTVGSAEQADVLAGLLVEERVAACVQLLPITSVYRWEGVVQREGEILLLIKAPTSSVANIETLIAEHHPYDVPELLHVAADGGLPPYLAWIAVSTGSTPPT